MARIEIRKVEDAGFTTRTGEQIISEIENSRSGNLGRKFAFIFNGVAYKDVDIWTSVIDGTKMAKFTYTKVSSSKNIADTFHEDESRAKSEAFPVDSLVGYELVEVWVDRRFLGTLHSYIAK